MYSYNYNARACTCQVATDKKTAAPPSFRVALAGIGLIGAENTSFFLKNEIFEKRTCKTDREMIEYRACCRRKNDGKTKLTFKKVSK